MVLDKLKNALWCKTIDLIQRSIYFNWPSTERFNIALITSPFLNID